jgi:surface protein
MANPITKILHFSTEIQNVHSAGTLIEAVNCGSATLPLPSDDYIQFTLSDIANGINLDFNYLQGEDTVIEGSITIDYGDGERDVISAWEVFNGRKGILRKTFSESKERTITVFGEIRDMTFNGHGQITSVIVKGMSSINNGWAMFRSLGGMTSCDVSEFDTKNITNFGQMFYGCKKVATLDVSSFDTSKSTAFHRMFSDNEVLESINLSNFVTSKAENMSFMFDRCFLLTTLNLASFDTSEVLDMQSMFSGCRKLTGLNLSSFNTSKVTNMSSMFASAFMSNPGNVAPEGITFGSNFNTSEVKNMQGMFNHCAVASLDLSQFDTSKVESMQNMFSAGYGLQSLNVSSFDTSSVVTMAQMFENCVQLTSLNLEHFDTRKVTIMQSMFGNAAALSNLQISSWDTRSVGNMYGMFRNAFKSSSSNVTLDLSMWDVRVVGYMDQMFLNTSSKLTNVSLENWCVPLIDSKPTLWNGNDQYGTAPAFSQEPTWGDTECAYCCPDNYEYLITTGLSTSTSFELTLDSESTEVVFVYSGFDDGGKLCVNFEQPDGSGVDEDEEFKDVSINGTIVGTVTKLLKNGADNNIIHYTNSDGCFSGEYKDDSGTVIMTEVNAPTPTPVGSISEFTAENLCQYESGRFEDFSGSYICVNKPLTNWNNPSYMYIRFIENGLYEYDGMVNGKPSYKLENEYGTSTIEYRENYDSNFAGYVQSGTLNQTYRELASASGALTAYSTNVGGHLAPKTEWKTYNSRKNKLYPWCDFGDNPLYVLVTDPDECVILNPTPTPEQTPTPISQPDLGGDDTLASTTSTLEAVAGTKVIEIPDSDTSKFSANMEIVIAPDDDTKREENVIDSIGSLILKNELQNTHLVGTRIVEKTTSNNEDDSTPTPTQVGLEAPVECPDGQHPEWKLPNGDPCNPSQATLKTFFGLSMNLNNVWENVFDGLSIKFGEQETANGVDYLPIYAKVDNDKITLSSRDNISEWNKLFIFVGDNINSNTLANGEGMEFDTIVSDDLMLLEQHTNSISAKIHFRFANINGIPTLQVKNILKPTNSVFENRDTENDWSSVYVGLGYNLNDDVWPTASVDVNYEIGPITYSSLDCNQVCVDDQTPTPTFAQYLQDDTDHAQVALDAYNQTISPVFAIASTLFSNFGLVFSLSDHISAGSNRFKIIVDDDSSAPESTVPSFVRDTNNNEYRLYVNSGDLVINTLGSSFAFYEWDSEQNDLVTYGTGNLDHYFSGDSNNTYWKSGVIDLEANNNFVYV